MRTDRRARRFSRAAARALVAASAALCAALASCDGAKIRKHFDGPTGTLEGRIRLAEGLPLPSYLPLDLARRPLHATQSPAAPAECERALEDARTPVKMDADRALSNVVVAASDFAHARGRMRAVHRLAVQGCRLDPPLIAATEGDLLWLENHDPFPFRPLFGPAPSAAPLEKDQQLRFPLAAGVDSVLCSSAASCGRSDIVVFHHPVHAVSNARGGFRIAPFPAGELVRVTAWHPLFEETQTFVWLEPGQRTVIELVMYPKARFLPSLPTPAEKAP